MKLADILDIPLSIIAKLLFAAIIIYVVFFAFSDVLWLFGQLLAQQLTNLLFITQA